MAEDGELGAEVTHRVRPSSANGVFPPLDLHVLENWVTEITQFSSPSSQSHSFTRSVCTYSMGDLGTQFSHIVRATFIHPLDLHVLYG